MTTQAHTIDRPRRTQKPKAAIHRAIYLDNHATTPIDPIVLDTMLPYLRESFGNPASSHAFGVTALFAVEQARAQVAAAINAKPAEIIFTSGATESNNFVIKGIFEHYRTKHPHVIVSSIEHKCILEAAKHVKALGAEITVLPANAEGLINPVQLKKALRPTTVLVSIMFANNEIGSINPVRELAKICHEAGVIFHTDAAQVIGKIPVDVNELGIDLMSASGHKFYGPKGVGFVYMRKSVQRYFKPLLDGGAQESGMRSGTLNVAGIVGLGKAIELVAENLETHFWHYLELRNYLYEQLRSARHDLILNGPAISSITTLRKQGDVTHVSASLQRLPQNLNVTLPGVDIAALQQAVNFVAFSSSSACSSGSPEPSYVLRAIGRSSAEAQSSLRFGIGIFNTEDDVRDAAAALIASL